MPIQPFHPGYSQSALEDLRERIRRTRWPDVVQDSNWTYGFDLNYLQRICRHWCEQFDWKAEVEHHSQWQHFQWSNGLDSIHFVHQRGRVRHSTPILLLHGWPGSFLEMQNLIPLLNHSFDVIVPSLPGFGYSGRPSQPGMNTARIADLLADLMTELGYERFACHGGDFGAGVSSWLARRYPSRIIGIHLNYIPSSYMPGLSPGTEPSQEEKQFLDVARQWEENFGAYSHLQITTPLTAAYGLNDSPAALAAWILEKFRDWADCSGDLEERFTWDELLANVTLYWMTETIHSSCRLYLEGRKAPLHLGQGERIDVPCAIAHLPREAPFPPRSWIERGYNVQQWTEFKSGGHFAAMEEPTALAADIHAFFESTAQSQRYRNSITPRRASA